MPINEFPLGQTTSVKAASIVNVTPLSGVGQTIDGTWVVQSGDKILLQNQTNPLESGVWIARDLSRPWIRDPTLTERTQLLPGKTVYIENGTAYGGMDAILANQAIGGVIAQVWNIQDDGAVNATAIALNTTHSGGDGSDHADVATNTTHSSGDGSDHQLVEGLLRGHITYHTDFPQPVKIVVGIPILTGTGDGGGWTPGITSGGLETVTRTAAATTESWWVPIPLAHHEEGGTLFIDEMRTNYTINTADADDVRTEVWTVSPGGDGSARTAAVWFGDQDNQYQSSHNTAAERGDSTAGPELHMAQVQPDTGGVWPYDGDADGRETYLYRFYVDGDAGGAAVVVLTSAFLSYRPLHHDGLWQLTRSYTAGEVYAIKAGVYTDGGISLRTDTTNEVQYAHLLMHNQDYIDPDRGALVTWAFMWRPNGATGAVNTSFVVGLANVDAATFDAVQHSFWVRCTDDNLDLLVEYDDGATDYSADSGFNVVKNTLYWVTFDMTDDTSASVYIRADGSTTWTLLDSGLDVSGITKAGLFAGLEKNSAANEWLDVFQATIIHQD